MIDKLPDTPPRKTTQSARPRRLRRWFIVGFALVFLATLGFMNHYFYTGDALLRCKLWQFYLMEIRRTLSTPSTVGPTAGSGLPAVIVFLRHVGISAVGGLLFLGIGAIVTRSRDDPKV